jgi:hypothetical protein
MQICAFGGLFDAEKHGGSQWSTTEKRFMPFVKDVLSPNPRQKNK